MAKATHTGECQVCGSGQKLPGGLLSNHGYTVRWGFFSGTCTGARELPFEQSKDLIEAAITRAQEKVAEFEKSISALRNPTEPKATVRQFVPGKYNEWGRYVKSHHVWKEIRLGIITRADGYQFIDDLDKPNPSSAHAPNIPIEIKLNLLAAAKHLNGPRISNFMWEIERLQEYIAWQQKRIKDWAPKPLKPIKE